MGTVIQLEPPPQHSHRSNILVLILHHVSPGFRGATLLSVLTIQSGSDLHLVHLKAINQLVVQKTNAAV